MTGGAIGAGDPLLQGYNDVPYASAPDPARHPERLAALGTLFGLRVAPVATCRVLELACGDGANLVAMASTLPAATFVGFDFAAAPIARARQMARELGAANVELLQLDLREAPATLGTFDYVIAHGLYSWVDAEVRAHILPLIAKHLAADGVALVSYNAMPGCHMRAAVWEMLRYHTRGTPEKAAKLAAARALLQFVGTPAQGDTLAQQAMRAEASSAATSPEASLAHDDLGEATDASYFHEFAAEAADAGLAFLAEARSDAPLAAGLTPQVKQALERLDRLTREQYLDFVLFRHFRESLLCHATAPSTFAVQASRALDLYAVPTLALRREASKQPTTNAALGAIERRLLEAWPRSVRVADLDSSRDEPRGSVPANTLGQQIVDLYAAGRVDLRTRPVEVAAVAGEHPEAFAAARWLNRERDVIPSLYHESLRFQDATARKLLALLDGTRSREALCAAMGGRFAGPSGALDLDGALAVFAGKALLVR